MSEAIEESQVKKFLAICRRRVWLIVTSLVVVTVTVGLVTLRTQPVYRATSQILIEKEDPKVVGFEDVYKLDAQNNDYYQTQYRLIKSRCLLEQVLDRFSREKLTESQHAAGVVALARRVEVEPVRGSRLVNVSLDGHEPTDITDKLNFLVHAYIAGNMKRRLTNTTTALDKLSQQVVELKPEVEKSAQKLHAFKASSQLVSLEDHQNIIVGRLTKLNEALTSAETDRIALEAQYRTMEQTFLDTKSLDSFIEVLTDRTVLVLKSEQVALHQEFAEVTHKYMADHPKMKGLVSKIEDIAKKLKEEEVRILGSVRLRYERALAQERMLRRSLSEQETTALELNRKAIQFGLLRDEADRTRRLYDVLVQRRSEIEVTIRQEGNNIHVIDPAEVPLNPIRPRTKANLALSVILGLAVGISMALFLEHMDDSIKGPEDAEKLLGAPVLGYIPVFHDGGRSDARADLVTLHNPRGKVSEAYRALRTGIVFSAPDERLRKILVTSAAPGEGKTISATNLAITMAQTGGKVLLVDSDMRHPRVHTLFNLNNTHGLSNLLIGEARARQAIKTTSVPNLHVMTSGPIPPNPSELLGSQRMKKVIHGLSKFYDRIIFDSPPSVTVTDANILGTMVNGVVVVVRASSTARELARRGASQLRSVNARILGTVLNHVPKGRESYYYHSYYHQYYYGSDEADKTEVASETHRSGEGIEPYRKAS